MKTKRICVLTAILTILAISVYNINNSKNFSSLLMSNIEALSLPENGTGTNENGNNQTRKGGYHVVDGSCKVKVDGKTYNGTWNKCESDDSPKECKGVCITGLQF